MSQSIRLHPVHGVNPTIPTCFWCGQEKNEIAMLGAAYKGEAPMKMVLNYEPCAACTETFNKGVVFVEATPTNPDGRPPLSPHASPRAFPTGRHVVVKAEAAAAIITDPAVRAQVMKFKQCLLNVEAFTKLFAEVLGDDAQTKSEG